jgi:hypothetical protein
VLHLQLPIALLPNSTCKSAQSHNVGYALLPHWARKPTQQAHGQHHLLLLLLLPLLLLLLLQVFDTPSDHVTRDYREGLAQLGDLRFRVVDTSGLEPAAAAHSLQVSSRSFCEGGEMAATSARTLGPAPASAGVLACWLCSLL